MLITDICPVDIYKLLPGLELWHVLLVRGALAAQLWDHVLGLFVHVQAWFWFLVTGGGCGAGLLVVVDLGHFL